MEELPFSLGTVCFPSSSSSNECTGRLRWLVSALTFSATRRTNCVVDRGDGAAFEANFNGI